MKKRNLSEGSKSYHNEAYIYERFSQLEDTPSKILDFLKRVVKEKYILDLGCGTGKYLIPLAPLAKVYWGLDISEDQLRIAELKSKANGLDNVRFLCSSAESINLPDESRDVVISTWVLGTILDEKRREKATKEAERVLKRNGKIFLVENDIGGEFEAIRGRYPDIRRTKSYNDWLESRGFRPIKHFETYFEFDSLGEAKEIFCSIWGKLAADKITDKKINQRIVIYCKGKI